MANTRCKPKGEAPLCACGCGQPTNWQASHNRWAKFIDGHQNLGRVSPKRVEKGDPPLCACGCGLPVGTYRYGRGWVRYLNNHAPRKPHTPEALEKMQMAALKRSKRVSTMNHAREWSPESREKARQSHLAMSDEIAKRTKGGNNPNWRGGHAQIYHDERNGSLNTYQRAKLNETIRQRDGQKCVLCGVIHADRRKFPVHHLDNNLAHNDPSNLVTLCVKCHGAVEFGCGRAELLAKIKEYLANLH